nr:reverse transcriptase domain-containing protein [Tanacetum cinerariifolium]
MSTRSTSSNLFSPLRDPESLIRRRNLGESSSLFDFEETTSIPHNNQGLPPAGPPPQNNNGPPPVERYKLSIDWCLNHNTLLVTQIDTFYNGLTLRHQDTINAEVGGTFMKKRPEECYDLIENMTTHHNHWDTSATRDETYKTISFTTTTESPKVVRQLETMNKNFHDMMRQIQSVKYVNPKCETYGGPNSFTDCPAVGGYTQEVAYATTANPRGDVKAITTRSGVAYEGPSIPPISSSLPKEVEREPKVTKDKVQTTRPESTVHVHPPVVRYLISEPDVALKPNPKLSIPYPLRLNDQKLQEKTNSQMLKFLQIFQRLHCDLSFANSILHIPSSLLCLRVSLKKLSLPNLTPTHMTLELATRSIAYPTGIAEDVFVQVGKFTFLTEFVIVDYDSNVEIIDPILEKFTDEPALDYLPPPGDDDDDLFDLNSDNDEWKMLLYGDCYKGIDSEKDKNKGSIMKLLVVEDHIVESNDLLPQLLDNESTLPEESFEMATLSSSPFRNEDKVFKPGILIWEELRFSMMNQKIRIIK